MGRPARPWIVTRHDPIEKWEDNLWVVQGDVPPSRHGDAVTDGAAAALEAAAAAL